MHDSDTVKFMILMVMHSSSLIAETVYTRSRLTAEIDGGYVVTGTLDSNSRRKI